MTKHECRRRRMTKHEVRKDDALHSSFVVGPFLWPLLLVPKLCLGTRLSFETLFRQLSFATELPVTIDILNTSFSSSGSSFEAFDAFCLMNNLRYAFRQLRKSPAFTFTALATVAICLGANLAIFAVINSILLRPLPFPQRDRLVTIYNTYPKAGVENDGSSVTNYYERRGNIPAFSSLSIYPRPRRSRRRTGFDRAGSKSCASHRTFSRRSA